MQVQRHNSINSKATTEFTQGVRLHHSGGLNASHKQFIEASADLLKPLNDESDRFATLLATLQIIAAELEQSSLTFKDVSKFHKRQIVVDALKRLEQQFSCGHG